MRPTEMMAGLWGILPRALASCVGIAVMAGNLMAQGPAVTITSDNSATFVVGVPGTFTVAATGSPAPSFSVVGGTFPVWATLDAATGLLSGTPPAATGTPFFFLIQAANGVSGAATQNFTLTVVVPPAITFQLPTAQTLYVGQSTSYLLSATGTPTLTYQWRKDGVPIVGATSPGRFFNNVQLSDAGAYDVVVSNAGGNIVSSPLALTILPSALPSIIVQPVGGTLNIGNVASFGVTATGTPSPTYQWRKNSVGISGATNSVYVAGAVSAASAGSYDVVVTNVVGSVTSNAAVLVVNPRVYFNSHPAGASAYVGNSVAFTVSASGTPSLPTLQWRKDGLAISGATASTLTLPAVQLGDAGSYDVVATNSAGSATSNPAVLAVSDSAPLITQGPASATVALGSTFSSSINAAGSRPLSYQWRRNGIAISGATNATLQLPNVQSPDAGAYSVVVSNALGNVTSTDATLTVVPRVVSFSSRLNIGAAGAFGVFTVEGPASKKILLRAVGPGLAVFGVAGVMPDPQVELFDATGALVALNNDWSLSSDATDITNTSAAVGAIPLASGSRDSAIVRTLAPGSYTVRARPASGAGGVALLELYDADLVTGAATALPFVALRGNMDSGILVGGLGSLTRGVRSYLVRAVGPALGLSSATANPTLIVQRDATLIGSNDNWDANSTEAAAITAATARVAAFALPAGSLDAAVVLNGNLHATGAVQVTGSGSGLLLVELHDLDAARPVIFAPIIVSGPMDAALASGDAVTLRVLAHGTPPLAYQWRKDGANISGATAATLAFASIQAAQGGQYSVAVSNAQGSFVSVPAVLTVQGGSTANHAVVGNGYVSGGTVTITNTFSYSGTPASLGWTAVLPAGWAFVSDAGTAGDVKPFVGATGTLDWAWSSPPSGSLTFTYTVSVPAGASGAQTISATAVLRTGGSPVVTTATPSPLGVPQVSVHSADTSGDFRISLLELTRVIELYNTRNGTTRTGAYLIATTVTEDGFAPDPVRALGTTVSLPRYHAGDTDHDGRLSLIELTRIIELYNYRNGTTRTGEYHVQGGTEDGFSPGP